MREKYENLLNEIEEISMDSYALAEVLHGYCEYQDGEKVSSSLSVSQSTTVVQTVTETSAVSVPPVQTKGTPVSLSPTVTTVPAITENTGIPADTEKTTEYTSAKREETTTLPLPHKPDISGPVPPEERPSETQLPQPDHEPGDAKKPDDDFDDEEYEPTILPAYFPNLLVNGGTGISAGYATEIPPHNITEVINATIYRINHPTCTLKEIMNIVQGPDFPTGGIVQGIDGIKQAYETGRGKIIVKSKTEIVEQDKKFQLVISEIPYEVNKSLLITKGSISTIFI